MEAPILNAYGVPAVVSDLFAAFEFLSEGEKYVRPRNFKTHCGEMKLDANPTALFKSLDLRKAGNFEFEDIDQVFKNRESWTAEQEEFFRTVLSCEFQYDTGRPNNLSGSEISKLLKDAKGKWKMRITALIEFVIKYTREGVNRETFDTEFKKVKKGWGLQLHDRRSAVVRVAAIALSKICQRRPRWMSKYAAYLIEVLFECVRMKVEVISLAGAHCVHSIVMCVPDPLKKLPIFEQLCVQARSKFIDSRKVAMSLITKKTDYYIEAKKTIAPTVWKRLSSLLCDDKFGLRDADADVRVMSYGLMARAEMLKMKGVDESMRMILVGVPRKAYEDEKQRLQTEKQLPKNLGGIFEADGIMIPKSMSALPGVAQINTISSSEALITKSIECEEKANMSHNGLTAPIAPLDQAELLKEFNNPLPDPPEYVKSMSVKKLSEKFSSITDCDVDDLTILQTLAIIRIGEKNEIDQNAVEVYLEQLGIPRRVVEEAYSEYLEIHHMNEKLFERRPLGISVIIYKGIAVISSIQNSNFNDIQLGSRIVAINGERMDNKGYRALMKVLQDGKLPLRIRLKLRSVKVEEIKNNMDENDAWSNEEVQKDEDKILEEMMKILGKELPQPTTDSGVDSLSKGDLQAMKIMHKANMEPVMNETDLGKL